MFSVMFFLYLSGSKAGISVQGRNSAVWMTVCVTGLLRYKA